METTGVYYEKLAHFLNDKGFNVSVVLANKMKAFSRVVSPKSRTDEIDSRTIALYGLERQLQKWDPPSVYAVRTQTKNRHHQKNIHTNPTS